MTQFYLSTGCPQVDAKTCQESQFYKRRIAIAGESVVNGRIESFTGIVQSVEEFPTEPIDRRWRVTILDYPEAENPGFAAEASSPVRRKA
jgi:hypothetical protein